MRANYELIVPIAYLITGNQKSVYLEEDPVCKLDVANKVRLCTLVMNTPYYKNKNYIFQSTAANVDAQCRETVLSTRFAFQRTTEFMYRCLATNANNNPLESDEAVYISRSYRNQSVYSFSAVGSDQDMDVVIFVNRIKNLPFVVDIYAAEMEIIEEQSINQSEGAKVIGQSTSFGYSDSPSAVHPESISSDRGALVAANAKVGQVFEDGGGEK